MSRAHAVALPQIRGFLEDIMSYLVAAFAVAVVWCEIARAVLV